MKEKVIGLSRRELAELLGVHMMTVTKWERDGLPIAERGRRGKPSFYSEVDVRAWLGAREEAARNSQNLDVSQERARKERAQAILAEQTFAIRAGGLVPRDEVEKAWGGEVSAVRAKLLLWPTMISDRLHREATLSGLPGVEKALQDAVEELLLELSEPGTPRKRTTRKK